MSAAWDASFWEAFDDLWKLFWSGNPGEQEMAKDVEEKAKKLLEATYSRKIDEQKDAEHLDLRGLMGEIVRDKGYIK